MVPMSEPETSKDEKPPEKPTAGSNGGQKVAFLIGALAASPLLFLMPEDWSNEWYDSGLSILIVGSGGLTGLGVYELFKKRRLGLAAVILLTALAGAAAFFAFLAGTQPDGAPQALSAERDALAGFELYRFGVNEQELRKLVEIGGSQPEDGGTRLRATKPTVIYGVPYGLSFLLKDKKLFRINLTFASKDAKRDCDGRFKHIFGLVRAKYGEPDDDPEIEDYGGQSTKISFARFTFRDRATIVASTFESGSCIETMIYTAGSSGGSD
jgi:hypothetical protein